MCTDNLEMKDVASIIKGFVQGNRSENLCHVCINRGVLWVHQHARVNLGEGRGKYQGVLPREVSASAES